MTDLPQKFRWSGTQFHAVQTPGAAQLLVADSWRVSHGDVWGLDDHLDRFFAGITAQTTHLGALPHLPRHRFAAALREKLRGWPNTALFPRISVECTVHGTEVVLLIRRAPAVRTATSLWVPHYTDPRTRPTVKGPDIDLLRSLTSDAPTDDVVLHDGTNVIETTTGALLIWPTPDELVLCQADQQLASISAQRLASYARSQGLHVMHRPVTIAEVITGQYPVWCANTLHGISPVTSIASDTGEQLVRNHPDAARWQAAWWQRFNSAKAT